MTLKNSKAPAKSAEIALATSLPAVLVVGDWLVDEHWVVGDHRWPSSSRIGMRHSRALHRDNCSVRALCGAGQVATILHQARNTDDRSLADVFGVGLWRQDDTAAIAAMLDPINNRGKTPHSIWHQEDINHNRANSHNIQRLFNLAGDLTEPPIGTTRVIRIYQQTGDTVDLMQRVDWELPVSISDSKRIFDGLDKSLGSLIGNPGKISHIVVKDLRKGAVTDTLTTWLAAQFKDANWYVSSKAWRPVWLDKIKDLTARVKLIVVPEIAIRDGVREKALPSSHWITPGGELSDDALRIMNEIGEDHKEARIVVLPGGMTVLAREAGAPTQKLQGFVQPESVAFVGQEFVPMASVFFPALICRMVASANHVQQHKHSFLEDLKHSLSFTRQWMEEEARRLTDPGWVPKDSQILRLGAQQQSELFPRWRSFNWKSANDNWKRAFSDLGILVPGDEGKGKKELQLWRAMTDVGGYVACVRSKRRVLRRLLEEGEAFTRDRTRHRSFMVIDVPGAGKSFLVNRLARALRMRFLSFNVTQMLTRNDLIECFDTIVTSQAQDPNQPVLVFIDEINAKLDGQHVYDAFLAPLEDGIYIRAGKTFHIGPCFWVFAGTEQPVPRSQSVSHDRSEKGSDFESRLTSSPFDLKLNVGTTDERQRVLEEELARMEKVYIGVAAIRNVFPDVRLVSSKVLSAFKLMPMDVGPREISRFVKAFEFVQYGRVTERNLPKNWYTAYGPKEPAADAIDGLRSVHRELQEAWDAKITIWKNSQESDDFFVAIRGESG